MNTIRWLVRKLFGFSSMRLMYFETSLSKDVREVVPGRTLTFRRASVDEVLRRREEFSDFGARYLQYYVDEGHHCYFAECDGQLAGYSWLSTDALTSHGKRMYPLVEGGAYSHTSYVAPQFRGCKVFQFMLHHIYCQLQSEGYRFVCNIVAPDNAPSIRVRENMGAVGKSLLILRLPFGKRWVVGGEMGAGKLVAP